MFLEKLRASALKWENWLLSASAHCSLLARGRIVHLMAKDRQQAWSLSVHTKYCSAQQHLKVQKAKPKKPRKESKEVQGWQPWQLPTTNAGYSSSSKCLCLCRKAKTRLRPTLSNNPLSPASQIRDVSLLRDRRPTSQERQTQMGRRSGRVMPTEWQSTPSGSHPAPPGKMEVTLRNCLFVNTEAK